MVSVLRVPLMLSREYPTAHASLADMAATPPRERYLPLGTGMGTTLHCTPSQCLIEESAVAHISLADTAAIPPMAGPGLSTMRQLGRQGVLVRVTVTVR